MKKNRKQNRVALNVVCIILTIIITVFLLLSLTLRNATAENELKDLVSASLDRNSIHKLVSNTDFGKRLKAAGMSEKDINTLVDKLELKDLIGTCAVDYSNYLLYGDTKFSNDGKLFTEKIKKQSDIFDYMGHGIDTTLTSYFNKMLQKVIEKTDQEGTSLKKVVNVYQTLSSDILFAVLIVLLAVVLLFWNLGYKRKRLPLRNAWKNCGITLLCTGVFYMAVMRTLYIVLTTAKIADQGAAFVICLLGNVFNVGLYPGIKVAAVGVTLIFLYAVMKFFSLIKKQV